MYNLIFISKFLAVIDWMLGCKLPLFTQMLAKWMNQLTCSLAFFSVHTITDVALITLTLVASSRVHTLLAARTECLTLVDVHTLPWVHGQFKTMPAETHHPSVKQGTILLAATVGVPTRFVSSTWRWRKPMWAECHEGNRCLRKLVCYEGTRLCEKCSVLSIVRIVISKKANIGQ